MKRSDADDFPVLDVDVSRAGAEDLPLRLIALTTVLSAPTVGGAVPGIALGLFFSDTCFSPFVIYVQMY